VKLVRIFDWDALDQRAKPFPDEGNPLWRADNSDLNDL
jgi:hypothetical protein